MGFSVNQPAIGAPLQFFPAMGSKQLDEMIDAYVPGDASILEKRTAVSMEFFQHSIATGELFKFFMVYPTVPSANTSPTMESEYHSSYTSSPAMSDSQWTGSYSTSSQTVSLSTSKRATAANDFSNLPGMKIMTKDGRDVTNSASRGCKTKEQRDHAHLMRMLKACDSCRRKKTKCDPSHKRPAAGTSSGKITKKSSKTPRAAPAAAAPPISAKEASINTEFDNIFTASLPSLDFSAESLNVPTDGFSMEWDQFIQYDEEPIEAIPYDYDFFLDPAGYFSPAATTSFSSSSTSPSQVPITPIDRDVNIIDTTTEGHDHKPILPYLNPGGLEAGGNYVDFNLYSPQSSFDEDLDLMREVAASPVQSSRLERRRHKATDIRQEGTSSSSVGCLDATCSYRQNMMSDEVGDGIFHSRSPHMNQWSERVVAINATDHGGVLESQQVSPQAGHNANLQACVSQTPMRRVSSASSAADEAFESATSDGLYGRHAIYEQEPSRLLAGRDRDRLRSPIEVNAIERGNYRRRDHAIVSPAEKLLRLGKAVSTCTNAASSQTYANQNHGSDVPSRTLSWAGTAVSASSLPTQAPLEQVEVRSSPLSIAELGLTVAKDRRTVVRYEQSVNSPMMQVPRPSESPSPVATSWPRTRSSAEQLWERITLLDEQPNKPMTHGGVFRPVAELGASSAVLWNSGCEPQPTTEEILAGFSLKTAMGMSDILTPMPIVTGLGFFSVILSLRSPRAEVAARNNSLVNSGRLSGNRIARYATTAILLLSIAQPMFSQPISFLVMVLLTFLAGTGDHRPQYPACSRIPTTPKVFNTFPSDTLPGRRQTQIGLVDGFKSTCTKLLHTVRCNLKSRLLRDAPSQIFSEDRASPYLLSQRPAKTKAISRWNMVPLV